MTPENYRKRLETKSIKWLTEKAVEVFNAHIRRRDSYAGYFRCISCGKSKSVVQMQAGHYYPAGKFKSLKFNEDNVNGECIACNYYSGDHLITYRKNLIKKIGEENVLKLDMKAQHEKRAGFCKLTKFELIDIISKYRN